MTKVISIYEAKTQFSKLVKKAQSGETIYIGAYGHPQAILSPAPVKKPIKIGVWAHKKKPNAYKSEDLVGSDPNINNDFEESLNRPLP
jgi:antitoxin (DNA-binding transcriptional repressor) of toxin-antitoxin stability system